MAALLAVAVYANSLGNGLVLDDRIAIVENPAVRDPLDWRRLLLASSWVGPEKPTTSYRPLTTWTFALNYAAHDLAPFGYHVVNVVGHAAVSALLVLLCLAVGLPATTSAVAGALFAVHPIHTEVVANGVGRADVLAAGFALLALLVHRRAAARGWAPATTATLVGCYSLSLLAKEHTIGLLLVFPLADLLLTDGGSVSRFVAALSGRRALCYAALVAATAGYFLLRSVALGDVVGDEGKEISRIPFWLNPAASAPPDERVLTALRVLALAVRLLVVPLHLSTAYYYRHIPVVSSLSDAGALAGLLVAVGLVALGVVLWRRHPLGAFWLALALATYAVVSNLFIPIGTIFGERFLYLPSAGFCVLAAMALARLTARCGRAAALAVPGALVLAWGVRTVVRNPIWHDELRLAETTVADAPDSAHAYVHLGTVYAKLGRNQEALRALARAADIYPEHPDALYNAGVIHQQQGDRERALALFRRLHAFSPRHFAAWVNRAAIANEAGDFTSGLEAADRAVALVPDAPNGHVMRGFALRGLGRSAEARAAFQAALRRPRFGADALYGLAATALDLGDATMAAAAFEHLVRVAPSAEAYRGLVTSYRRAGRDTDARRALEDARQRFPAEPFFAR